MIITKKEIKKLIMDLPSNTPEEDFQIIYEAGWVEGYKQCVDAVNEQLKRLTKAYEKKYKRA